MVFGNLSTGYWLGAAAAAGLHWQEIGRTTLSGTATTINVPYTDKPYVKILVSWARETGATGDPKGQLGDSSADTGSNYARRLSEGGGADSTNTSVDYFTQWATGTGSTIRNFQVISFVNNASNEKLIQEHGCFAGATGSGSAPYRTENVAKWANTSAQAGYFSYLGSGTTFSDGAEVVVLGYDPDDTEGGSVWQELADVTLGSAGDTITTSTFTAKKYLMVQTHGIASGNLEAALQVGNGSIDTGSNYAVRWQVNGTEGTGTSKTSIDTNHTASGNEYINYFIVNAAAKEKLVIAELIDSNSAGAGNAPNRVEHTGKWTNTSNQINIVQAKNVGSGSFDTGSSIKVWGFD